MEDFLMREIVDADGDFTATRTRTNKGFRSITLKKGTTTILTISSENYGDDYEQQARNVARLLDRIVDNPCQLPKDPS